MHCLGMVRHVLDADHWFDYILVHRGNIENYKDLETRPYVSVQKEVEFYLPHRKQFLDNVRRLTADEFEKIEIVRSECGKRRSLSNFLLRVSYHE